MHARLAAYCCDKNNILLQKHLVYISYANLSLRLILKLILASNFLRCVISNMIESR